LDDGESGAPAEWWRYAASFFRHQTRYRHHGLKRELTYVNMNLWAQYTCAHKISFMVGVRKFTAST
jgi:hypothetical protein